MTETEDVRRSLTLDLDDEETDTQAYLNRLVEDIQKQVDDLIQKELELLQEQEKTKLQETESQENGTSIESLPRTFTDQQQCNNFLTYQQCDVTISDPLLKPVYYGTLEGDTINQNNVSLFEEDRTAYSREKTLNQSKIKVLDVTERTPILVCDKTFSYTDFNPGGFQNHLISDNEEFLQDDIMITPSYHCQNTEYMYKQEEVCNQLIVPEPLTYVDWFCPAVMACVCCFFPTGMFAVVNAVAANTAALHGDLDVAVAKATTAKKFIILTLIMGPLVGIVILCLIINLA